jgi:DNA-binding protein HU-beta
MEKTMNKADFVNHIAQQHKCTKTKAEKSIDMFTSSVIDAIGKGNEISLTGFGNFFVSKVAARTGRNPRSGKAVRHVARQEIISLAS